MEEKDYSRPFEIEINEIKREINTPPNTNLPQLEKTPLGPVENKKLPGPANQETWKEQKKEWEREYKPNTASLIFNILKYIFFVLVFIVIIYAIFYFIVIFRNKDFSSQIILNNSNPITVSPANVPITLELNSTNNPTIHINQSIQINATIIINQVLVNSTG